MRPLPAVVPSPEQISILSRTRAGTEVIRGAAGSGKTTTALLRLRSLIGLFLNRRRREQNAQPVRVLVLTYNRTLRGYIGALTQQQTASFSGVKVEIETFGRWSVSALGRPAVLSDAVQRRQILTLGAVLGLPPQFLLDEVEYVLGRFMPRDLNDYLTARRYGRGSSPRMEKSQREQLLETVIKPYIEWKKRASAVDWNDLALRLAQEKLSHAYDIIIVDEAQDFSANQIRAVHNQLMPQHSLTFVLDSAQRIYARGFTWAEAGLTIRPENIRKLEHNYRNTIEIAKLAASLIRDIPIDDDGTIPNFESCDRHGPIPVLLEGRFGNQMRFATNYVLANVNLKSESVAFLHPQGGGWFAEVERQLSTAGLDFVDITRLADWPGGSESIALSTMHSAKGIEFDHVIIIGLNAEVTVHGETEDDDRLITLRRLLAMSIGRAKMSVILGYKPGEESQLIRYMDPDSFRLVKV